MNEKVSEKLHLSKRKLRGLKKDNKLCKTKVSSKVSQNKKFLINFTQNIKRCLDARVKIDQILQQKHGGLINKLTQKLGKVVKKKEIEKVRKAREVKKMISSFSQLLEQKRFCCIYLWSV